MVNDSEQMIKILVTDIHLILSIVNNIIKMVIWRSSFHFIQRSTLSVLDNIY